MNRDDIIRMAREAGMIGTGGAANEIERLYREAILDALPRFAALVAAAEREECAKVVEPDKDFHYKTGIRFALETRAAAIRARGNYESHLHH